MIPTVVVDLPVQVAVTTHIAHLQLARSTEETQVQFSVQVQQLVAQQRLAQEDQA